SKWSNLLVNLRRMLVLPAGAQAIGDVLDDDPIGAAFSERFKNLVQTLNAPLGAGEGSFLFQTRTGGKNHVGKAAGLAEEDLLHHKEVELRQSVADIVGVGVDEAHFFAEYIHCLEFAIVDGVYHHVVIEPRLRRQLDIPRLLKL